MYKLNLSADSASYTVLDGNTNVAIQLDGGDPRVRADQLGAAALITVQWTLGPSDYNILRAMYRTGTNYGALPFQIDLVGIDDSVVRTYTARFVPGTFKLASQIGLTYVQTASLWVVPLSASSGGISGGGTSEDKFDDIVVLIGDSLAPPATGQKIAWAKPTVPSTASPTVLHLDTGSGSANEFGGGLLLQYGASFDTGLDLSWGVFVLPADVPVGAIIDNVLPVVVALSSAPNSITNIGDDMGSIVVSLGIPISGVFYGHPRSTLTGLSVNTSLQRSLFPHGPPAPAFTDFLQISFVAAAVYYHV